MFKRGMDNKGQLSVEYLLLLVVIFVVFGAMITYLIGPSIDSANDISDVSAASNTVNTVANAVNLVYANGPGSKRVVTVYIPQDNMRFLRTGNYINLTVTLTNGTKVASATTNQKIYTNDANITKGNHNIGIYWNFGEPYLRVSTLN